MPVDPGTRSALVLLAKCVAVLLAILVLLVWLSGCGAPRYGLTATHGTGTIAKQGGGARFRTSEETLGAFVSWGAAPSLRLPYRRPPEVSAPETSPETSPEEVSAPETYGPEPPPTPSPLGAFVGRIGGALGAIARYEPPAPPPASPADPWTAGAAGFQALLLSWLYRRQGLAAAVATGRGLLAGGRKLLTVADALRGVLTSKPPPE